MSVSRAWETGREPGFPSGQEMSSGRTWGTRYVEKWALLTYIVSFFVMPFEGPFGRFGPFFSRPPRPCTPYSELISPGLGVWIRGGTFYKMLGLYLRFHARFIHARLIGVMANFWKVGVAPTTPLYTKTPPLVWICKCIYLCKGTYGTEKRVSFVNTEREIRSKVVDSLTY